MQVISKGSIRITTATIEATWRRGKPGHRPIIREKDCPRAADPASGLQRRVIKLSAECPPVPEIALPGSLDYPLSQDLEPHTARATGLAPAKAAAA
jgi:hypothetical protein